MKRYIVYSPEYQCVPMSYDPPDPGEYGADACEVEANNKRDAIMLGVAQIMRTQRRSYAEDNRGDGLPPWAGYKAEQVCAHECHKTPEAEDACGKCCADGKPMGAV